MKGLLWLMFTIVGWLAPPGSCVKGETTEDVKQFKELMHQIFLQELGEDLRRKLESISNEGVILGKSNAEIDVMVRSRLSPEEKVRMRKAFEAVAGPTKKFARQRVKGKPVQFTRSSQFKKLQDNFDGNDVKNSNKRMNNKYNYGSRRGKSEL